MLWLATDGVEEVQAYDKVLGEEREQLLLTDREGVAWGVCHVGGVVVGGESEEFVGFYHQWTVHALHHAVGVVVGAGVYVGPSVCGEHQWLCGVILADICASTFMVSHVEVYLSGDGVELALCHASEEWQSLYVVSAYQHAAKLKDAYGYKRIDTLKNIYSCGIELLSE